MSSGLWIFQRECLGTNLFGYTVFEVNNFQNFLLDRTLWILNFLQGMSGHQLYLVMLNLRSINLGIFSFTEYSGLWIFNAGGFWSPTFLVMLNLSSNFLCNFFVYRALWILNFSEAVSRYQIFLVIPNLRSKIFWNVFIYRALWTLNFTQEGLCTNFFWSR